MLTLDQALPETAIILDGRAGDWREAIGLAGQRLTAAGFATPEYTDEMIDAVEKLGPYMVITPGVALAHSRPSPAVLGTGLSWVRLAEPVEFGHPKNDPVQLVIGLAARDEKEHLDVMSMIARALGARGVRGLLDEATSAIQIQELLGKNAG